MTQDAVNMALFSMDALLGEHKGKELNTMVKLTTGDEYVFPTEELWKQNDDSKATPEDDFSYLVFESHKPDGSFDAEWRIAYESIAMMRTFIREKMK